MPHAKKTIVLNDLVRTVATEATEPTTEDGCEASLVFIYPKCERLGRRYVLGSESAFIGRATECLVPNPDASVSRTHARIDRGRDGRFTVTDLNSTNGTFVNHARVLAGPLRDGDYLRVGNCIYRFLSGGNVEAMYHEEIYRLTVLDPLTGVHNRRYLQEYLEREVARAVRHGRPMTVVMFDIDHFKSINDRLGHLAGDLTLKEMAGLVQDMVRKDELYARYGGEEFAVVLPEADADAGRLFGERVRTAVEQHTFVFEGQRYPVTVSVGVGCMAPDEEPEPEALIQRADERLYDAKRSGRNRVCG